VGGTHSRYGLGPSDKALDISGSFGLGNTYRGLNSSLGVDAAEMRLTFPDPEDLCATLRVKSGYVEMGGNSQIGYIESANKPLTGPDTIIDNMRASIRMTALQAVPKGQTFSLKTV
jgi:hypothetical protein